MKKINITFLGLGALLSTLVACKAGGDSTGHVYMPDMMYSRAYETYAPSPDNKLTEYTALKPVEGTVTYNAFPSDSSLRNNDDAIKSYMMKAFYPNTTEGYEASSTLKNPLPNTKENIERGKAQYAIYCKNCHGESGDGNGSLVANGVYSGVPNYKDRLPTINDGKAFYSIAYGKGKMGSHAGQISVEDRWRIVHYINSFVASTPKADTTATNITTKQ